MKYKDSRDAVLALTNHIDENYLPLPDYKVVAGENFITRPAAAQAGGETIVNRIIIYDD